MITLAEALAPKSDQLNADDLIAGPRVLKLTAARIMKDGRDIKIVLNYEGDNGKPWKPCKTMGRAMVMAWTITDPEQFAGKSVRVYRDPTVRFGDQGEVGGIRISHMSHLAKAAKVKLTVSQGKKGEFTFNPLVVEVAGDALTIDMARAAIEAAADLDALRAVWSRKTMAPFRADLQATLDARKAALSGEGPDDTQRGEAHTGDAAELIRMFEAADTREAYDSAKKAYEVMIGGLSDAEATDVETARDAAADRVMG